MKRFFFSGILIFSILLQPFQVNSLLADRVDIDSEDNYLHPKGSETAEPVVNINDETGFVSFIGSPDDHPIPVLSAQSAQLDLKGKAGKILEVYASQFGINSPATDLSIMKTDFQPNEHKYIRYQQLYKGIPVLAGELIINMSKEGDLYSMSGEVSPNLTIDVKPAISKTEAMKQALELMIDRYFAEKSNIELSDPSLWIYDERLLRSSSRPAELVWRMEARATNGLPVNVLILVNAIHGGISLQFNQVDTDVTGRIWQRESLQQEGIPTDSPTGLPTEPQLATETVAPSVTPTPTETVTPTPEATAEVNAPAKSWYVSTGGNDANDCLTTTTPCAGIQIAVDKAANGDTIKISAGRYLSIATFGDPRFHIDKNLSLLGGWNDSFTQQNGRSILDGTDIDCYGCSYASVLGIENSTVYFERLQLTHGGVGLSVGISANVVASQCLINDLNNQGIVSWGTLTLKNCTVFGNGQSGILVSSGSLFVSNSTITKNRGGGNPGAGGILSAGNVTIQNSIIAGNTKDSYPGDCGSWEPHQFISNGYNLIGTISGCDIALASTDMTELDPGIAKILSDEGVIKPLPNSPVLDSGSPAIPGSGGTSCEAVDQVGTSRPVDGNNNGTAICDIGAYESGVPAQPFIHSISAYGGTPQSTKINTSFTNPLVAVVLDQYGFPVSNVLVTFTAPGTGATAKFQNTGSNITTVLTDSFGLATTSVLLANGVVGDYTIQASIAEISTPTSFSLQNWDLKNWYISTTGNDNNDCLTPLTPCAQIDTPFSKSTFHPKDSILVEAGTYIPKNVFTGVSITNSVNLKGGWDSSFTNQIGYSTIDAQKKSRRVLGVSNFIVSIDHFIFENGNICDYGAGIVNYGNTILSTSIIRNNDAGLCSTSSGGGIANFGQLSITKSAILNNSSMTGGGIYNDGQLSITNSTISGNQASYPNYTNEGTSGRGGGLTNLSGSLTLKNVTITNNSSSADASGIFIWQATSPTNVIIKNSIIAGNLGGELSPNCGGIAVNSGGNNLFGSGCTIIPKTSDKSSVDDTQLTPLLSGGFHVPLPGSLAIDNGNSGVPGSGGDACEASDQVGTNRPLDGNGDGTARCDIGAIEFSMGGTTPAFIFHYKGFLRYTVPNQLLPLPFGATVLDLNGKAVSGINVTFTAPTSGASGVFSGTNPNTFISPTNGSGVAIAGNFTANSLIGVYTVQAVANGIVDTLNFQVTNGARISIYTMNHQEDPPGNLPGTLVCTESLAGCTNGNDLDADKAQAYSMETYSFYLQHHNRNSLDGNGMKLVGSVHYGNNYQNAFWDGTQTVFGDSETAEDTVGHEFTHGVTQYTSGLFYYYQSGAISESFSDLWGEFIDQTNKAGVDNDLVKWKLGEDHIVYRDMKYPHLFQQPEKMTSSDYHYGDEENFNIFPYDNGGVHENSGINNKAVYLMTDGDTFNGFTIQGIGLNKVAAIYYETQTHLLVSGSDYKDLFYSVLQACKNLTGGVDGITHEDCIEVEKALSAVEMFMDPLPRFMPEASICDNNSQPNDLFFDDFESVNNNWDLSNHTPPSVAWARTAGYATSGNYSLYVPDANVTSNVSATLATPIQIPASGEVYLHFNQSFGFEFTQLTTYSFRAWDGGVLEYKVGTGAWQDIRELFDSGTGYKEIIYKYNGGTNPLAGNPAFARDSHGFVSTRYKLSIPALQGNPVLFRWRVGTDSSVGSMGWFIDDVRVYTCESTFPGTLIFKDDFSTQKYWTDNSNGLVYRENNMYWLNWTSTQSNPMHYTIPIFATNDPIQLNFRFTVNSSSGDSLLWVGLASDINDLSPGVAGADLPGIFVGIDSTDKIQFLSLNPDQSFTAVDGSSSNVNYGGKSFWRRITLTVDQLNWKVELKQDNGVTIGEMSGILSQQHSNFEYLTLMFDFGGGSGSMSGILDDFFVLGTNRSKTFADVPFDYSEPMGTKSYWLYPYIQALWDGGYTAGCVADPLTFCPALQMDRAMSSVFMLRGNFGRDYQPPPPPYTVFTADDWSLGTWAQPFAEGMWKEGLTAGCQQPADNPQKLFCPWDVFTRAQAAVFGLRLKYGMSYGTPTGTMPVATGQVFADLTDTSLYPTAFAEAAYAEGLLPSCGMSGGKPLFCPDLALDRAWAAYLIVNAKGLPLP